MAKEKDKGEYRPAIQPIPPVDEQVAEILSERQRHFDELRLSKKEREALAKARRKEEERKRKEKARALAREKNRVTTYLPTNLIETLERIAEAEGVSVSQVITFFLFEMVDRYDRKEVGFWGFKYPSRTPRYPWILVHPKDSERMQKVESRKSEKS